MVTTLHSRGQFALLATILYVTAPLVEAAYYTIQEGRGTYPSNADTIAIPIYSFTIALIVFSPIYAIAVWLAVRTYQGGRSLLAFDVTKLVRSVFWSLLLGGIALYDVGNAVYSAYRMLPVDVISGFLWAYLFLCLRSSLAGGSVPHAAMA